MIGSSMRGRMTFAFALALSVLMGLCCIGLTWYARRAEEQSAASVLKMAADTVRQESMEADAVRDPAAFLRQESDELRRSGFTVRLSPSASGAVAASESRLKDVRYVRVDVGKSELTIELPWSKIEERLQRQMITLVELALFAIAAGTAGAWFLVGKTLSPIAALSSEADAARIDRLHVHLSPPSSDTEIRQLVTTLNRLLDRLSSAAEVQSRFYAAASHELRTPLHTLAGHLEVGLSRPRSAEEYRETLKEAHRQSDRLCSLVHDLLLLTRLNTAPAPPASEAVSLGELCELEIDRLADRIADRRLVVRTDFVTDGQICAPPNHAEMIVRNVIENAVNYSTPGGAVEVNIAPSGAGIQVEIVNDCIPIQVTDIHQLLEPFFRPDSARTSETGGNGLGLAICNAIAQSNGWALDLCATGSRFQVTVSFQPGARASTRA